MDPEDIVPREIDQLQKGKYCTSFTQGIRVISHRHGKSGGCQELGEKGEWELMFKGHRVLFCGMKLGI